MLFLGEVIGVHGPGTAFSELKNLTASISVSYKLLPRTGRPMRVPFFRVPYRRLQRKVDCFRIMCCTIRAPTNVQSF